MRFEDRGAPYDVSVCIPAWNAAHDLERLLDALPRASTKFTLQTIVVDNGSLDHTNRVLGAHPEVEVIRNGTNVGITRARNQALDRANGRYIVMFDADTVAGAGAIDIMVDYLESHDEVGLVGPRMINPDGSLQLTARRPPHPLLPFLSRPPLVRWYKGGRLEDAHLMRDFDHAHARPVDWVSGACQCYRASLLDGLGTYDERIFSHGGEDYDWCMRVWKAGYEVHYVPESEVMHVYGHFTRRHPFSKQARRALTDFYYVFWKHRDVRNGVAST